MSRPVAPPREYARVVRAVGCVLRAPDLSARRALPLVPPPSRVFYDVERGLRLIIVTEGMWAEAWMVSPTKRRASLHTAFLEQGVIVEFDEERQRMRVVHSEDWPWPLVDL